jgi:hypothetical protein
LFIKILLKKDLALLAMLVRTIIKINVPFFKSTKKILSVKVY